VKFTLLSYALDAQEQGWEEVEGSQESGLAFPRQALLLRVFECPNSISACRKCQLIRIWRGINRREFSSVWSECLPENSSLRRPLLPDLDRGKGMGCGEFAVL